MGEIVGKYNFQNNKPVSPDLIKTMCDKIVYRGPDDNGLYTEGSVGLSHRRLSSIDLSTMGYQSISSRTRRSG